MRSNVRVEVPICSAAERRDKVAGDGDLVEGTVLESSVMFCFRLFQSNDTWRRHRIVQFDGQPAASERSSGHPTFHRVLRVAVLKSAVPRIQIRTFHYLQINKKILPWPSTDLRRLRSGLDNIGSEVGDLDRISDVYRQIGRK